MRSTPREELLVTCRIYLSALCARAACLAQILWRGSTSYTSLNTSNPCLSFITTPITQTLSYFPTLYPFWLQITFCAKMECQVFKSTQYVVSHLWSIVVAVRTVGPADICDHDNSDNRTHDDNDSHDNHMSRHNHTRIAQLWHTGRTRVTGASHNVA